MFLHEAFCLRNNKFCPQCNKVIEVAEWDEHVASHNVVKKVEPKIEPKVEPKVVVNNNNIANNNIASIKPVIQPKTKECKYCGLQLHLDELVAHEISCGARSSKCEYCNSNVLLQELKTHYMLCDAKLAIDEFQNEAFMEDQYQDGKFLNLIIVIIPKDNKDVYIDPKDDNLLAQKLQMELDEKLARE
jgi:hypothetical protein